MNEKKNKWLNNELTKKLYINTKVQCIKNVGRQGTKQTKFLKQHILLQKQTPNKTLNYYFLYQHKHHLNNSTNNRNGLILNSMHFIDSKNELYTNNSHIFIASLEYGELF